MKKIEIFICYHKQDVYVPVEGYTPIHVGKAVSDVNLPFIGDNTGDNISEKNPWYCELTAQYWIWKNVKDAEYVGLAHYRRNFAFKTPFFQSLRNIIYVNEGDLFRFSEIDEKYISRHDVILSKKMYKSIPIYDNLCYGLIKGDVDVLGKVVESLYPEFKADYDSVMQNNELFAFNMLIAKKSIFDAYSEWLFNILFEFEKRLTVPMNPYQPRLLGFYSERLMMVYFRHFNYKIGHKSISLCNGRKNKLLILIKSKEIIKKLVCFTYKKCCDK